MCVLSPQKHPCGAPDDRRAGLGVVTLRDSASSEPRTKARESYGRHRSPQFTSHFVACQQLVMINGAFTNIIDLNSIILNMCVVLAVDRAYSKTEQKL